MDELDAAERERVRRRNRKRIIKVVIQSRMTLLV
jgi:predicted transposase YbfD/YdcC